MSDFANIFRSRLRSLLRPRCILSRTPRTRSLSTCAAWRSASPGSSTWTPSRPAPPRPSCAPSAARTSPPPGNGTKQPKVGARSPTFRSGASISSFPHRDNVFYLTWEEIDAPEPISSFQISPCRQYQYRHDPIYAVLGSGLCRVITAGVV